MTDFLIFAVVAAALSALIVLRPLLLPGRRARGENRAEADAALYRDQLEELERDRARGTISDAEAEGARAEISRRLIRATRQAEEEAARIGRAPRGATGLMAGIALFATPLLAAVVYLATGSPGQPDFPLAAREAAREEALANRPSQAQAEAQARAGDRPAGDPAGDEAYARMVAELEDVVAARPDDIEGHELLASALIRQERYGDAWPVLARLAELHGNAVPAEVLAAQAEAMVLAAGGYVSPEANRVLARALAADPGQVMARYYAGLFLAQTGRAEQAASVWRGILANSPADAPWRGFVETRLAELTGDAPVASRPRGPSAEDLAAAEAMSPEDRMAMIEAMVARLDERLLAEGGEPEEWLRLITAYRQLDRMDEARRVYALSQERLEGSAAGFIREQALVMGVIAE